MAIITHFWGNNRTRGRFRDIGRSDYPVGRNTFAHTHVGSPLGFPPFKLAIAQSRHIPRKGKDRDDGPRTFPGMQLWGGYTITLGCIPPHKTDSTVKPADDLNKLKSYSYFWFRIQLPARIHHQKTRTTGSLGWIPPWVKVANGRSPVANRC